MRAGRFLSFRSNSLQSLPITSMSRLVRVLHQLLDAFNTTVTSSTPIPASPTSISTPYLLTSSPPEPSTLRATNRAFLTNFASANVREQHKIHVRRWKGIIARLQTELTILKKEVKEVKAIYGQRKERASGKRVILKGKTVISTEKFQNALEEGDLEKEERQNLKTKVSPVGQRARGPGK